MQNIIMESSSIFSDYSSAFPSPTTLNESSSFSGDDSEGEPEWLETEVVGFRTWQLLGIILSVILAFTIMVCCCVRFRIPRTKQEIEADYIRKRITRSFRKELSKINDKEMDDMDLRRALDRLRDVFDAVKTDEVQMQDKKIIYEKANRGLGKKFNSMFHGMRVRFNKEESTEFNTMI